RYKMCSVFRSICHTEGMLEIGVLCMKGIVKRLRVFWELEREDLKPDDITFLGLFKCLQPWRTCRGGWDEVTKVRSMMSKRGVRLIPRCSFILVNGKIHEFFVGKVWCDQNVLSNLEEVVSELKFKGYEPYLNKKKLDIEDDEKESQLILQLEDGSCF
ncbi:pentatricopeptide repeat-containing protein At5g48910-like protein, partial [Trifolium pratense]